MASDTLKRANLVPLLAATSEVWQYFGFKNKDGSVTNGAEVCLLL